MRGHDEGAALDHGGERRGAGRSGGPRSGRSPAKGGPPTPKRRPSRGRSLWLTSWAAALLGLLACGRTEPEAAGDEPPPATAPASPSPGEPSVPPPAEGAGRGPTLTRPEPGAGRLLAQPQCEGVSLFHAPGLYQDLAEALGPTEAGQWELTIPEVLHAHVGFGGDLVYTLRGVRTHAARVWDLEPGGAFSASIEGSPTGDRFQREGYVAAKKLIAALRRAQVTSRTESGWTITTHRTPQGRVECEERAHPTVNGGQPSYTRCSLGGLLSSAPYQAKPGTGVFCPAG